MSAPAPVGAVGAVVFDLYGTLFDVHSVAERCEALVPTRGREMSLVWRQKQLEATWLRSLMGHWMSFEQATEDALVSTCRQLRIDLPAADAEALCGAYLRIAPFPEVPAVLEALNESGLPLAILSNGSVDSIAAVVGHAGLAHRFARLISVDAVRVFKPHPRVYELAEGGLGVDRARILFVSSNAWDAAGAGHFGFQVCWVNRSGQGFDELGHPPDHQIAGLQALPGLLSDAVKTRAPPFSAP